MAGMADHERVLEFWFGELDDRSELADHPKTKMWWKKDPQLDAEIERQFGALISAAERGELDDWRSEPDPCVALVIVLDQFRRNVFRNDPRAFALDPTARVVVREGLDRDLDESLSLIQRCFFYMPLMHSESLDDHELATAKYGELVQAARERAPQQVASFQNNLDFEHRHREIIERFGRYPHRNAILGRASTNEELAFLEQPGSSF